MARRLFGALALSAIAVLSGCNDDAAAPEIDWSKKAEERLITAMNHDDYQSVTEIVADLWEVRDTTPENARNTFLLGTANLWWLAEASRPGTNPVVAITKALPMVLESFNDALQNDPADRAMAQAFLGALLVDTGFDRVNGSLLVEQSMTVPETGWFARMAIRRLAPADDSLTTNAIEDGYRFWETCIGGKIDRDNPDFTPYVKPLTSDPNKKFCFGSTRVPHGYSGAWMIFGDMLVKGGKLNAARRAYLNAKLIPNYDKWAHKGALEARLNSDLAARAATYTNRDPTKWATIGDEPFACTQCHASVH